MVTVPIFRRRQPPLQPGQWELQYKSKVLQSKVHVSPPAKDLSNRASVQPYGIECVCEPSMVLKFIHTVYLLSQTP